ncbi:hypothetical protein [Lapillicoccus jejuensis]|uniref:Uncharacterized protein n=1 Tax=Lapillicoccus jejuensis TaxID=402171 RepID=A0A542E589_9MICO|nr:hypothetical protein [Lapillicoccus jejuensis]TQJ10501.1 hypothetical protein FB458_3625 [Lapillicoccus jejuensis]
MTAVLPTHGGPTRPTADPATTHPATTHPVTTTRSGVSDVPGAVPWATVLVAAVVLGAADLWWVLVLRGAVGFIQRARSPFTVWATEVVLWLPLVALGVLLGLTAAQRVAAHRRGASVAAVGGMVAGASAAGVALLAVQAVYDTALQRGQVSEMSSMVGKGCDAACVQRQLDSVAGLQLRAFGVGVALVVVTNVVLATWLWAAAGGRLRLTGPATTATAPDTVLRRGLAATLAGTAAIHLAVVPEHLEEWPAAGAFFLVLATVELLAAAAVLRRLRGDLLVVVAVSVVPLVVWLVSRTMGLPIGPEPGATEAVGPADVVSCLLELGSLLLVGLLVTAAPRPEAPHRATSGRVLVLAVAVTTVVGLSWTGIPWLDAIGVVGGGGH